MCDFWVAGGNVVKRKRVNNPTFQNGEVINTPLQELSLQFSPEPNICSQLQTALLENALLKEKVSNLEKKVAKNEEFKTFGKGKPFSSLSPDRKRHRRKEIRDFMLSMSQKLPRDWVLEEVH